MRGGSRPDARDILYGDLGSRYQQFEEPAAPLHRTLHALAQLLDEDDPQECFELMSRVVAARVNEIDYTALLGTEEVSFQIRASEQPLKV